MLNIGRQGEVNPVNESGVWFVAADVCRVLDIDNPSLAVNGRPDRPDSDLDEDEKGVVTTDTLGGKQKCQLAMNQAPMFPYIKRAFTIELRKINFSHGVQNQHLIFKYLGWGSVLLPHGKQSRGHRVDKR